MEEPDLKNELLLLDQQAITIAFIRHGRPASESDEEGVRFRVRLRLSIEPRPMV